MIIHNKHNNKKIRTAKITKRKHAHPDFWAELKSKKLTL